MTVDVRDDADCHIGLLESVYVDNGERYIAWSTDTPKVEEICASIDRLLPELGHDTPDVTDNFPDRIKAREAEFRAIWAQCDLRNDRIKAGDRRRVPPVRRVLARLRGVAAKRGAGEAEVAGRVYASGVIAGVPA